MGCVRRTHRKRPPWAGPGWPCKLSRMPFLKAKIFVKNLRKVFYWSDPDEKAMQVQLVRLWVLYTDLQLEFDGASADCVPELDRTSVEARRFYFIRRTTATLMELRSVIQQLNLNAT